MYSSQQRLMNESWKVLFAVLSIVFIWQYLELQPKLESLIIRPTTATTIQQPTQPAAPKIAPVLTKEQQLHNAYKHAKFLAVVETPEKVRHNKTDLFCLAKNIFHEAGTQSAKGKMAVAEVTVNRMKDPRFSGNVCSVVFAANQFSWANNRHLRWSHPSGEQWNESMRIAQQVLDEGKRIKGMENVLFYHADYVHPHWKHVTRLAQIGAHIFYVRNA